jgi:hypothetical protein
MTEGNRCGLRYTSPTKNDFRPTTTRARRSIRLIRSALGRLFSMGCRANTKKCFWVAKVQNGSAKVIVMEALADVNCTAAQFTVSCAGPPASRLGHRSQSEPSPTACIHKLFDTKTSLRYSPEGSFVSILLLKNVSLSPRQRQIGAALRTCSPQCCPFRFQCQLPDRKFCPLLVKVCHTLLVDTLTNLHKILVIVRQTRQR